MESPCPYSEQTQLRRFLFWWREVLGGEPRAHAVEIELLAGRLEAAADHPGHRPGASLTFTPLGIIVLAAAHVADQLEHMAVAIREIRHQPFAEQVAHFERQAKQDVTRFLHANSRGGVEDALHLG